MTRACLVLAAGAGSRMGGRAKALLQVGGESFLARIVGTVLDAGLRTIVVTGAHADAVAAAARMAGAEVAPNPGWQAGMASSLRAGLAALGTDLGIAPGLGQLEGVLVWPVDHPLVRRETVARLLDEAHPRRIVVPSLGGRGGHPTWFGRDLLPALADPALDFGGGARAVVRATPPERVIHVMVDDPGVRSDIDTPADYAKIQP
jgi:nicotine blue oxidoreductase